MRSRRCRAERGAAVVDFVLVSLVLIPLVLGIIQVALVMHVHNVLAAAATEGARYGATVDRDPDAGVQRTREQIADAVGGRYARAITASRTDTGGVAMVVVRVHATVPALGLWGPAVSFDVVGHGVEETGG
jgi:Flp pilus assembly protein TadG